MSEYPTAKTVSDAMAEFRSGGRSLFLTKYANGRGARSRFIFADNNLYDMKAVWAAAHTPAVSPREYHPTEVERFLKDLGIEVIHSDEPPFSGMFSTSGTSGMRDEEFEILQSYCLVVARPNQSKFRDILFRHYNSACAISGANADVALEAAHVLPFASKGVDELSNGILLRADLHRLFDAMHLAIDPTSLKAIFSSKSSKAYSDLNGKIVKLPAGGPNAAVLEDRWQQFQNAGN